MSDSLSEQVNIRIAGDQLPDAFMGVGFSNYDIANYGADGTFLDLTPYINAEIMPNLTKILDEHPNIRAAITMSDAASTVCPLPSRWALPVSVTTRITASSPFRSSP